MNLAEARKNERYTQQEVADYLGISRPTYRKMEDNPETVTIEDAKKLAKLFNADIADIFFGSDCN
ncbi:helix-turn-helix transcriptional regulator [uncultured Slackia sp.]|uniref:helix-turn-helix transcriptional regulator n=1 Tax=uncultured Slackia sp. TaxID=665903 RepID=UPI0026DEA625|nr:helix-turn-helix transcriptional regulator [uncultured Slackia sp.]